MDPDPLAGSATYISVSDDLIELPPSMTEEMKWVAQGQRNGSAMERAVPVRSRKRIRQITYACECLYYI